MCSTKGSGRSCQPRKNLTRGKNSLESAFPPNQEHAGMHQWDVPVECRSLKQVLPWLPAEPAVLDLHGGTMLSICNRLSSKKARRWVEFSFSWKTAKVIGLVLVVDVPMAKSKLYFKHNSVWFSVVFAEYLRGFGLDKWTR